MQMQGSDVGQFGESRLLTEHARRDHAPATTAAKTTSVPTILGNRVADVVLFTTLLVVLLIASTRLAVYYRKPAAQPTSPPVKSVGGAYHP